MKKKLDDNWSETNTDISSSLPKTNEKLYQNTKLYTNEGEDPFNFESQFEGQVVHDFLEVKSYMTYP